MLSAAPWWHTELDVTELLKDASGDELTFIELEHHITRGKFNKWIFKAISPREAAFYSHPLEGLPHDFVSDCTLDIEINVDSGQREKKKERYTRKGAAQAARSLTQKDDDNAKASGPSASAPQLPKYMQEVEVIDLTDLPGIATRGPVIRDASADTVNDEAIAKATQEWEDAQNTLNAACGAAEAGEGRRKADEALGAHTSSKPKDKRKVQKCIIPKGFTILKNECEVGECLQAALEICCKRSPITKVSKSPLKNKGEKTSPNAAR